MKKLPRITLTLALLALGIATFPALTSLLELDRDALRQGQLWRIATGHLTHFDWDHLTWDLCALLLLGTMAELEHRRAMAATLVASALTIGVAVLAFQPQFTHYRGLSGIDSALFGLVVTQLGLTGYRERHAFTLTIAALALTAFTLKCGFELTIAQTLFTTATTYAPVPLAHLVGAATGVAVAMLTQSIHNPILDTPPALGITEGLSSPEKYLPDDAHCSGPGANPSTVPSSAR
jgi:rhomboid family GlyGly-CTERM serine protease